jgi:nitrite reductase (NADH) large subunit
MATGIRPNKQLAEKIGLHCEKGIVVISTMQTLDPYIYSVGECVQHRGELFGLVAPVYEQAKVCANHLAGHGVATFKTLIPATILKVTEINLFSMGDFLGDETTETLTFQDHALNSYRKIVLRDNKIVGVLLYGDTTDSGWYMEHFKKESDISHFRDQLVFGKPQEEAA